MSWKKDKGRQAACLSLLARLLFQGVRAVYNREGGFWYFLDVWTPYCDDLIRDGLARLEKSWRAADVASLKITDKGKAVLMRELGAALARDYGEEKAMRDGEAENGRKC